MFLTWADAFSQLDFEVPLSPVIAPKKARTSEMGSDEVSSSHPMQEGVGTSPF